MRISRAGLLVVIAIMVPILVELRTVLAYFSVSISVMETVLIGALAVGALVLWAVFPTTDTNRPNGE